MSGSRPGVLVVGEADPTIFVLLGRVAALGFGVRLVRPTAGFGDGERASDVVLVPLGLDAGAGLALVRRVSEAWPDVPIVVLGEAAQARDLREFWRAGAADFLFNDESDAELGEAVDRVAARAAPQRLPPPQLSLVADGTHGAHALEDAATGRVSVHSRAAGMAVAPGGDAGPAAHAARASAAPASASPSTTQAPARPYGVAPAPIASSAASRGPSPSNPPPANSVARDLPLMDARLPELEAMMERDAVDLKDIEAFVTSDPSLVVTVIRASNAAYYRSPKLITNLRDACVRIGNRQVFALLLETLVQRSFQVTSPDGRKVIAACWRNATLTARLVRRLAEWTGIGRPEDVYVAGLLHNLGEMVLIWRAIEASSGGLTARLQADSVKIAATHESLGRIVSTRWGLPPLVQILTGFHHTPRPGGRPEDEKVRLAVLGTWALSRQVLGDYLPAQPPVDPATFFDEMALPEPIRQRLNDECTAAVGGL